MLLPAHLRVASRHRSPSVGAVAVAAVESGCQYHLSVWPTLAASLLPLVALFHPLPLPAQMPRPADGYAVPHLQRSPTALAQRGASAHRRAARRPPRRPQAPSAVARAGTAHRARGAPPALAP